MKGVLVVGHGSRQKKTEQTLEAVVEMARLTLPEMPMEIAYMEFGAQNIPAGLSALVARGAKSIVVAPYFLFDGIHLREDIPNALDAYRKAHPDVEIVLGRPFGVDARLGALLADRVREALEVRPSAFG